MGKDFKAIPVMGPTAIGDFMRYPGCRLLMVCGLCGWLKDYDPERVIGRLQELRAGGHATRLEDAAKRVRRSCPRCSKTRWRMQFGWPDHLTPADVKRLAARYRN